ncbi:CBS domain-containing protein [Salinibacter altiplanensis]|uniref:CBS domain-containing protein n=1 Tax=Salinibacter altiplanensis TaxID=1803181 RepID=UPI000C9F700F|nr:CBS domain-containing protein [Salinibacter altiplanensis]
MKVREAIHSATPALQSSDPVEEALGLLMEHHVRHLPVVGDDGRLVGVIAETRLMDAEGPDASIESLLIGRPVSVPPDAHIFDAARAMVEHDLSTVPVADSEGQYLGLLRRHDIFDQFAQMLSTRQQGAILALEVDARDYALSKLIHVIEQNEAKVLAVASELPENSTDDIRVTLKLNVKDTARVRHVLEHHDYHVVAAFGEEDGELEELVDEFVRYLEV